MDEFSFQDVNLAELLIVKRDFDVLRKITTRIEPIFQAQLTPYYALFCHEIQKYLEMFGFKMLVEDKSKYSKKDIRQKAKFFNLSAKKIFQSIYNIDYYQNEFYIHLLKYPQFGGLNIHDNIGISYNKNKDIVGNTQYAYYVFQDNKLISKPFNESHAHSIDSREIRRFAEEIGIIISSISTFLENLHDPLQVESSICNVQVKNRDFNTNRIFRSVSAEKRKISLLLLHLLSSIGFIVYIMKESIENDTGLLLRLEYITYHYIISTLVELEKYTDMNKYTDDNSLFGIFNMVNSSKSKALLNSQFRNCMMHFSLLANNGVALLDNFNLDFSVPFCGLIESQFGMDYKQYRDKIESELFSLYMEIKQLIAKNASSLFL